MKEDLLKILTWQMNKTLVLYYTYIKRFENLLTLSQKEQIDFQ